jgi:hypothetical protein
MKIERILWILVVAVTGFGIYTWQQRSFTPRCAVIVEEQLDAARESSRAPAGTETGVFIRADLATNHIFIGLPQETKIGSETFISSVEQEMDFDPNELLISGGNFSGGPEVLSKISPNQTIDFTRVRSAGQGGLDRIQAIYVPLP